MRRYRPEFLQDTTESLDRCARSGATRIIRNSRVRSRYWRLPSLVNMRSLCVRVHLFVSSGRRIPARDVQYTADTGPNSFGYRTNNYIRDYRDGRWQRPALELMPPILPSQFLGVGGSCSSSGRYLGNNSGT